MGGRLQIGLSGAKKARFEEIQEEIAEERGYVPDRPEVVGYLMAKYNESK